MHQEFTRSHAEYRAWLATISSTHSRRIVVEAMTLTRDSLGTLSPRFVSGDVTIDTSRDATRVLSLQLLDPTRSLRFENNDDDLPIYLNRLVRVHMEAWVPSLGKWVGPPVFTGPVVDFDRDGAMVTLTAEGMERLALGDFGENRTWGAKAKVTDVIRALLAATGEDRLAGIPDLSRTLPKKVTVTRTHHHGKGEDRRTTKRELLPVTALDKPWLVAQRLANSIDRVLIYDGAGRLHLRKVSTRAGLRVDRQIIASDVRIDRDPSGLRNRWIVLGGNPKGPKKRVKADVRLPAANKASGQSLGRNGQPRWLIEQVENSHLKTRADCVRLARRMRDAAVAQENDRAVDCLPMPHLEEHDLVIAASPEGAERIRVRQATLPLDLSGTPMTIGAVVRVGVRKNGG